MEQRATEAEFERLSWHDDTIYGLRFEVGDPERGTWHSDLVLDLDHIVEWLCPEEGSAEAERIRFRVAPATLTFHDVTDLKIAVDWGDSGGQTALHEVTIDGLTRERVVEQKICLDRPYYRWRILLNWPRGGEIAFGASGFSLSLRVEPRLCDQQKLSPAEQGVKRTNTGFALPHPRRQRQPFPNATKIHLVLTLGTWVSWRRKKFGRSQAAAWKGARST